MSKASREELIALLTAVGYGMYSANLNGTEQGVRLHRWHSSPKPGDLVVEISSLLREDDRKRVGRLVSVTTEPLHSDIEWDKIKDTDWDGEKRPMEKVYRITLLWDGTECRWTNARFVRIPEFIRDIWAAQECAQGSQKA